MRINNGVKMDFKDKKLSKGNVPPAKIFTWVGVLSGVVICTILAAYIPASPIRVVLGLFIILALPGYLLISALWPGKSDLDLIWRLGLIVPTSLALVTGVLLLVNYFGVYHFQIVILYMGFLDSILLILLAWQSTQTLKKVSPNHISINIANQGFKPLRWHWGHALLGIAGLFLIFTIVNAVITPPKHLRLTEFYVLTGDGRFVTELTDEELLLQGVKIGISNFEGKTTSYSVFITAQSASQETMLGSSVFTLADGASEERIFNITHLPDQVDRINLYLYLLSGNEDTHPYRTLYILIKPAVVSDQ